MIALIVTKICVWLISKYLSHPKYFLLGRAGDGIY
jgi:hypothetical protein